MKSKLNEIKDDLAESIFGKTRGEAISSGKCIDCGEDAMSNCYSNAGRKEFFISGLCEKCFDRITSIE